MGDLSNIPSKDCYFLHSVSGDCDPCSNCDGKILKYDKFAEKIHIFIEFCNECGLGLEELERVGIKTKIGKKLKD
jgi:hypothetical protein